MGRMWCVFSPDGLARHAFDSHPEAIRAAQRAATIFSPFNP